MHTTARNGHNAHNGDVGKSAWKRDMTPDASVPEEKQKRYRRQEAHRSEWSKCSAR